MKRLHRVVVVLATLLGVAASLVVLAPPAQAAQYECGHSQYFRAGDSRIQFYPAQNYWYSPKYRAGRPDCDGVWITHMGHWGYIDGLDVWDGHYRIRTYESDGTTTHFVGPWTRFAPDQNRNIRPEISNGRVFRIEEVATPCRFSDCAGSHRPTYSLTY